MNHRRLVSGFLIIALLGLVHCKSKEKTVPQQKKVIVTQKKKKKPSPSKADVANNSKSLHEILGVSKKEVRNNKLYAFVEDWYGVPYKYGGCKKSGVDCSCFTNILYEEVYGKKINGTAAEMYRQSEKITLEKAKEGDLVFFKISVSYVSHVGVLLRNGYFVHASTSRGVMVSNVNEAYFKKYFHSAGRL